MWVAKIKFSTEDTLIGELAVEHNISLFGFPLSYYHGENWIIVHVAATLMGEPEERNEFVKQLRKKERTINIEQHDDFMIGAIKEHPHTLPFYQKDIIHVEPALISEEGYEIVNLGCFEKGPLVKTAKLFREDLNGELLSIQERDINSITVMNVRPDLTEKQKQAMELAVKNGYYNSPREITLPELAEKAGISYSTFQVHLRKAESKLIPYYFE